MRRRYSPAGILSKFPWSSLQGITSPDWGSVVVRKKIVECQLFFVEAREGLGIVKAHDILAESIVIQLEEGRQLKVKAADLIHIGPPLDDDSPRKGCGGGGGCSSGGCGVPEAQDHDDE